MKLSEEIIMLRKRVKEQIRNPLNKKKTSS